MLCCCYVGFLLCYGIGDGLVLGDGLVVCGVVFVVVMGGFGYFVV